MVTDVCCTVAHCPCEADLHGADPHRFVTDGGEAICAHHPDVLAERLGVVRFPCQRKGGES